MENLKELDLLNSAGNQHTIKLYNLMDLTFWEDLSKFLKLKTKLPIEIPIMEEEISEIMIDKIKASKAMPISKALLYSLVEYLTNQLLNLLNNTSAKSETF